MMTTTTIRSPIPVHHAPARGTETRRHALAYEVIVLTGLAAITAIVGGSAPAICAALLVLAATGSSVAAATVMALALPFLAITIPVTAIWFLGAVATRLTLRRLRDSALVDVRTGW
jgi:hypothetical protein